ncbi:tRNA isopentenyltransferase-like protein [Coniella lustricola]|uniref:tRNA dimethylallyltransferase n=1 Tax=Coniella lustricola TaxID=2025994 RepID=A0A2T3ALK4_9PEZI|nr:tRNA isopentenyltransferase-like protein [Coniella lustricola]
MSTRKNPLVAIWGSTGTGKSELAVQLAARFNGEIINADAMQMYKGLPIITNKIPLDEQQSVPHHLLGNIGLDEETWVVGVFKKEASRIIEEIRSRGCLPIIVGGTHYYTNALLFKNVILGPDDESAEPAPAPADESSTKYPILNESTEALWNKLKEVDPVMADRWHPKDRRKIRRSLEIFLTTGRRASDIYEEQKMRKTRQANEAEDAAQESEHDSLIFWVHTDDQVLKTRLDRRVDKMLECGLMDEIMEMDNYMKTALAAGKTIDFMQGIWQSIGFKEFQPYLEALHQGIDGPQVETLKLECLEKMKTATRRYARYQTRWIPKKMMPLLEEQGKLDRLYVLDSTDVTQYNECVTVQAVSVTEKFLQSEDMPAPSSISEAAQNVLQAAQASYSSQATPSRKVCDICQTTTLTEEAWIKHIRGKSHRRNVRHAKYTALVPVHSGMTTVKPENST